VDLEKIRAIEVWTKPRNVSKVRSFMGLVGYYRILIEWFLNISHQITYLKKKGVRFEWTPCEISFQHLKDFLTSAPIF